MPKSAAFSFTKSARLWALGFAILVPGFAILGIIRGGFLAGLAFGTLCAAIYVDISILVAQVRTLSWFPLVRIAWFVLAFLVAITILITGGQNKDGSVFYVWAMTLLSFPAGLLAIYSIFGSGLLNSLSSSGFFIAFWSIMLALGWLQWFVLFPLLSDAVKRRLNV